MKKIIIGIALLITFSMTVLVGCGGKDSSGTESTASSQVSVQGTAVEESSASNSDKKKNRDVVLDLLKQVKEKTGYMGGDSGLGTFLGNFDLTYKEDIANPNTNSTSIDAVDKYETELYETDYDRSDYSASVVAITDAKLKEIDTSKVTFGCNPKNKGVVMAFVFVDGIYIYDVDENGKKVNDLVYNFPDHQ